MIKRNQFSFTITKTRGMNLTAGMHFLSLSSLIHLLLFSLSLSLSFPFILIHLFIFLFSLSLSLTFPFILILSSHSSPLILTLFLFYSQLMNIHLVKQESSSLPLCLVDWMVCNHCYCFIIPLSSFSILFIISI